MLRFGPRKHRQCHGAIQISQGSAAHSAGLHEEHPPNLPDKGASATI
jgi:hypothetical protein